MRYFAINITGPTLGSIKVSGSSKIDDTVKLIASISNQKPTIHELDHGFKLVDGGDLVFLLAPDIENKYR